MADTAYQNPAVTPRIADVLNDRAEPPFSLFDFRRHLQREHSDENLDFYLETIQYEKLYETLQQDDATTEEEDLIFLTSALETLVEEYLLSTSAREINIYDYTRRTLIREIRELQNYHPTILLPARRHVLQTMNSSSFQNFLDANDPHNRDSNQDGLLSSAEPIKIRRHGRTRSRSAGPRAFNFRGVKSLARSTSPPLALMVPDRGTARSASPLRSPLSSFARPPSTKSRLPEFSRRDDVKPASTVKRDRTPRPVPTILISGSGDSTPLTSDSESSSSYGAAPSVQSTFSPRCTIIPPSNNNSSPHLVIARTKKFVTRSISSPITAEENRRTEDANGDNKGFLFRIVHALNRFVGDPSKKPGSGSKSIEDNREDSKFSSSASSSPPTTTTTIPAAVSFRSSPPLERGRVRTISEAPMIPF